MIFITVIALISISTVHSQQWSTIGNGVEYRQVSSSLSLDVNNVLITYAGYLVDVTTVRNNSLYKFY